MSSALARVRIVAINDVYDLGNLPRLQTFLATLDAKPSAVTVAGDFLSPSTLSSIDGGRGMVATLRATGVTHVSFGNHEADIRLDQMYQRLKTLSKSTQIVNTNMRRNLPKNATWMQELTKSYSVIHSPCNRVKVALLGILSDEAGLFRDNTFKGIPIGNVIDSFRDAEEEIYSHGAADLVLPLTHASLLRDKELARAMLESPYQDKGVILGGHEHEPYDEVVHSGGEVADTVHDSFIRIFKSGMDAQAAGLIDLTFDCDQPDDGPAKLVDIDYELVEMKAFEPSVVVQSIVDKHESVIKALENEVIIDIESTTMLPPGIILSSERTRFEQTTVGSIFCQMIKEERETDVAMINGATIKGGMTYFDGKMSYAQLKKELPFPTKLVVVPMPRFVLDQAIHYSRTAIEEGTDPSLDEVPRRGYLQLDWDYEQHGNLGFPDDILNVALPRNLLNGFCKIQPLMDLAKQLKKEGIFPGPDDHIPALEVIVRHACKNRWTRIVGNLDDFHEFDLNGDGVLDRHEIKEMMTHYLGHEPADFVVDDMLAAIDDDENGFIDQGEFSFLLAEIERHRFGR
jgi:2',3'-cyclic-nucleotide 2'-phosphodiesterase (5'-nucleotidase family)